MNSELQALGQSHRVYVSTDPTEHKGGKPIHTGNTTKMSTPNFPYVAWITCIKQGSTTCVIFILRAGVRIVPAETSLETKQNPVPFTSYK